jgi:high mobility group protein B2
MSDNENEGPDSPVEETEKESKKEKKEKKTTKRKERKEKSGVKRALSAYMFYCKEKRPEFKKEHPKASFSELGKICGEQWKSLSDEDKKPFEKMHDDDKIRYEKEKEDAGETEDDSKQKKKRAKKVAGQPKKGKSAFVFFGEDKRKEMKEQGKTAPFAEMGKIIGDAWKALSDDEKKPYQDKAARAKEVADKAIAEWEAIHGKIEKKPRKKKAGGKTTKKKKKDDEDADEDAGAADDADD